VSGLGGRRAGRHRGRKIGFVFRPTNLLARTTALAKRRAAVALREGTVAARAARAALEEVGPVGQGGHVPSELSAVSSSGWPSPGLGHPSRHPVGRPSRPGTSTRRRAPRSPSCWVRLSEAGRTVVLITHEEEDRLVCATGDPAAGGHVVADNRGRDTGGGCWGNVAEAFQGGGSWVRANRFAVVG